MMFDYAFVGAGPASLCGAVEIALRKGARVVLIEAGAGLRERGCAGLKRSTCTNCAGDGCHVTGGLGGSSAIFGNKVCYFPASEGIRHLIPSGDLARVETRVTDFLQMAESGTVSNVVPHGGSPSRKLYDADVVYRGDYVKLIQRLVEQARSYATIRLSTKVTRAHRDAGLIHLDTADGDRISTRNLVIGSGRGGADDSRRWLDSLGCEYYENEVDIGFRLEAPSAAFEPAFFYQTDPKYKFALEGVGSSRTFCACRGGAIIPVKHGDGFFADGAFLNADTGRTNIALMVRLANMMPVDMLSEWLREVNRIAGGSLLLGELDIGDGVDDLPARILSCMPSWPTARHRELMIDLLRKVVGGEFVRAFRPGSGKVRVFGPSIDRFWPRLRLTEGFRTSADDVFAIGDATGVSRGILQAMTSGIAWASAEARAHGAELVAVQV